MRTAARSVILTLALGVPLAAVARLASADAAVEVPVTVSFAPRFEAELRDRLGIDQAAVLREAVTGAISKALGPPPADPMKRINVDVVVEWAKPTHPTPAQMDREPGLDFLRSKGPGGAEFSATLRAADGRTLGHVNFSYYAPTIGLASMAAESWADARVSIERFAHQVAAKAKSVG